MDRQRWPKVKELFQAALARPPEDRAAFVEEMCNGDEELRRETKRLLDAHDKTNEFIERPAFELAPELLIDDAANGFIGESIGHYQVESLLGAGGMGEVYLAHDERLHRKVALKFLPARFTKDPILNQRFRQEAQTASALNHPNIITIHEIGEVDGVQFMATEFVDGKTLRQRMDEAPVPVPEAVEIAVQIASALAAAHGAGIVHRDIKPENIMLRADGYVKVLDFGIAKLTESQRSQSPAGATAVLVYTQEGTTVGTPFYMSPEQARNERLDARTDLWSLGVILFEMIAGTRPFSGATSADVIARVLQNDPPSLDRSAPGHLRRIIARSLAKDKEKRYQSANDLRRDLQKVLDRSASLIRHGWRGAAIAALAVAAGSSAFWFWNKAHAPSPADRQSIAVLPFQNLSHEPDHSYLPEAMQGEILACLTKIGDLKVISRNSTQGYQSAPDNLREIGQQLGVANILEGSVQRMANDVRINVQLINAATGEHVWAHTYERTIENLFTVEREVAQTVADSLKINLRPAQRAKVETPPTRNAEAYDLFLRGVYEIDRAWIEEASSSGTATKAADYFRQAIAIDPEFSLAYASLARSQLTEYFFLVSYGNAPPKSELAQDARKNIDRSLSLTPDSAVAHLALGEWHSWTNRDYPAAIAEFQRAITLDPHLTDAVTRMAGVAMRQGRPELAVKQLRAVLPINPRDVITYRTLGSALQMQRKFTSAGESYAKAVAIDPNNLNDVINQTMNFYRLGDLEGAERILESYPPSQRSNSDYIETRLALLARKRDFHGMDDLVKNAPPAAFLSEWDRLMTQAQIAEGLGHGEIARNLFSEAHLAVTAAISKNPDDPANRRVLASLNVTLDRPEEAINEARTALQLSEQTGNFFLISPAQVSLAAVYARLGRSDDAFAILDRLASTPSGFFIWADSLKSDPDWNRIRSDPRFEKTVAAFTPE